MTPVDPPAKNDAPPDVPRAALRDVPPRAAAAVIAVALGLGTSLRLIPCFNAFWLDEIWSYFIALRLHSPFGVFTIHDSNNHHLMTFLMALLGDRSNWAWYRLPSLLAGVGSVLLAVRMAARRSRADAVVVALLVSFSFILIQFSSEARGYSLAVFFSLLAWSALSRHLETGGWKSGALYGAGIILGFLSQLIVLFFWAGAAAWAAARLLRPRAPASAGPPPLRAELRNHRAKPAGQSRTRSLGRWATLQLAPAAALAALYFLDLREMHIGLGDPWTAGKVLAQTFGFTFGLPVNPILAIPYAVIGLAALGSGVLLLHRDGDDSWILFLTATLAPVVAVAIARPAVVAPRYFVVAAAFLVILTGFSLARLFRRGGARSALAAALLAVFLIGNGLHCAAFLRYGRGGYLKALRLMADRTPGSKILTGFDHDYRTGPVVHFYDHLLPGNKELLYYKQGQWPPEGPDWVIIHSAQCPKTPPPQITDPAGNVYNFEAGFPYAGLSGFYWGVYRNARVSGGKSGG